jgi:hypothetical protein
MSIIVTAISAGIVGISIGFYLGIKWVLYQTKKVSEDLRRDIEKIFISVKDNIHVMTFKQRIHQFVHFTSGNYTVVYIMDKKELAIFENENCIAISNQLESKVPVEIMNFIDTNFKKQIDEDVINVQGYVVSKNFIKSMEKPSDIEEMIEDNELKYSLDDILDKISVNGMSNLTEEEKEFLNNYGK